MKLNQQDFRTTLTVLFPEAVYQDPTQQMHLNINIDNVPFPTFFRLYDYGDLVQLVSFLPCRLNNLEAVTETARLLHFINKQMDLPGFGIDEESGTLFYRSVLRGKDGEIEEKFITGEVETLKKILKAFAGIVVSFAAGKINMKEFLEKTLKQRQSKQEGAPAPTSEAPGKEVEEKGESDNDSPPKKKEKKSATAKS